MKIDPVRPAEHDDPSSHREYDTLMFIAECYHVGYTVLNELYHRYRSYVVVETIAGLATREQIAFWSAEQQWLAGWQTNPQPDSPKQTWKEKILPARPEGFPFSHIKNGQDAPF